MRVFLLGAVLVLPVGIIGMAVMAFFDNSKAEVDAVRKNFAALPGVELKHISDPEKHASCITAEIQVSGKGRMSFTGLEPASFQRSSHVWLSGIGPFDFRTRERIGGRESYGYVIDIGPDSPIPAAHSLGITSIPAAIPQYDKLLAALVGWPVIEKEWPPQWPVESVKWSVAAEDEIHFAGPGDEDVFYSLKRRDP